MKKTPIQVICPKCYKNLTISMTGEYICCTDMQCKYIIPNTCKECKSRYKFKFDDKFNMVYFECKKCNHIFRP